MADVMNRPERMDALIEYMRANGVRRLEVDGDNLRSIELSDAPRAPSMPLDAPSVENPELTCNCGHSEYQHDPSGACLEGCLPNHCRAGRPGA